jgi:hypothetical protein
MAVQRSLRRVPEAAEMLRVSEKAMWSYSRSIESVRLGRYVRIPQIASGSLIPNGTTPAVRS